MSYRHKRQRSSPQTYPRRPRDHYTERYPPGVRSHSSEWRPRFFGERSSGEGPHAHQDIPSSSSSKTTYPPYQRRPRSPPSYSNRRTDAQNSELDGTRVTPYTLAAQFDKLKESINNLATEGRHVKVTARKTTSGHRYSSESAAIDSQLSTHENPQRENRDVLTVDEEISFKLPSKEKVRVRKISPTMWNERDTPISTSAVQGRTYKDNMREMDNAPMSKGNTGTSQSGASMRDTDMQKKFHHRRSGQHTEKRESYATSTREFSSSEVKLKRSRERPRSSGNLEHNADHRSSRRLYDTGHSKPSTKPASKHPLKDEQATDTNDKDQSKQGYNIVTLSGGKVNTPSVKIPRSKYARSVFNKDNSSSKGKSQMPFSQNIPQRLPPKPKSGTTVDKQTEGQGCSSSKSWTHQIKEGWKLVSLKDDNSRKEKTSRTKHSQDGRRTASKRKGTSVSVTDDRIRLGTDNNRDSKSSIASNAGNKSTARERNIFDVFQMSPSNTPSSSFEYEGFGELASTHRNRPDSASKSGKCVNQASGLEKEPASAVAVSDLADITPTDSSEGENIFDKLAQAQRRTRNRLAGEGAEQSPEENSGKKEKLNGGKSPRKDEGENDTPLLDSKSGIAEKGGKSEIETFVIEDEVPDSSEGENIFDNMAKLTMKSSRESSSNHSNGSDIPELPHPRKGIGGVKGKVVQACEPAPYTKEEESQQTVSSGSTQHPVDHFQEFSPDLSSNDSDFENIFEKMAKVQLETNRISSEDKISPEGSQKGSLAKDAIEASSGNEVGTLEKSMLESSSEKIRISNMGIDEPALREGNDSTCVSERGSEVVETTAKTKTERDKEKSSTCMESPTDPEVVYTSLRRVTRSIRDTKDTEVITNSLKGNTSVEQSTKKNKVQDEDCKEKSATNQKPTADIVPKYTSLRRVTRSLQGSSDSCQGNIVISESDSKEKDSNVPAISLAEKGDIGLSTKKGKSRKVQEQSTSSTKPEADVEDRYTSLRRITRSIVAGEDSQKEDDVLETSLEERKGVEHSMESVKSGKDQKTNKDVKTTKCTSGKATRSTSEHHCTDQRPNITNDELSGKKETEVPTTVLQKGGERDQATKKDAGGEKTESSIKSTEDSGYTKSTSIFQPKKQRKIMSCRGDSVDEALNRAAVSSDVGHTDDLEDASKERTAREQWTDLSSLRESQTDELVDNVAHKAERGDKTKGKDQVSMEKKTLGGKQAEVCEVPLIDSSGTESDILGDAIAEFFENTAADMSLAVSTPPTEIQSMQITNVINELLQDDSDSGEMERTPPIATDSLKWRSIQSNDHVNRNAEGNDSAEAAESSDHHDPAARAEIRSKDPASDESEPCKRNEHDDNLSTELYVNTEIQDEPIGEFAAIDVCRSKDIDIGVQPEEIDKKHLDVTAKKVTADVPAESIGGKSALVATSDDSHDVGVKEDLERQSGSHPDNQGRGKQHASGSSTPTQERAADESRNIFSLFQEQPKEQAPVMSSTHEKIISGALAEVIESEAQSSSDDENRNIFMIFEEDNHSSTEEAECSRKMHSEASLSLHGEQLEIGKNQAEQPTTNESPGGISEEQVVSSGEVEASGLCQKEFTSEEALGDLSNKKDVSTGDAELSLTDNIGGEQERKKKSEVAEVSDGKSSPSGESESRHTMVLDTDKQDEVETFQEEPKMKKTYMSLCIKKLHVTIDQKEENEEILSESPAKWDDISSDIVTSQKTPNAHGEESVNVNDHIDMEPESWSDDANDSKNIDFDKPLDVDQSDRQKEMTTATSTILSLPLGKVYVPSSHNDETTAVILDSPANSNNDTESPVQLSNKAGGRVGNSSTPGAANDSENIFRMIDSEEPLDVDHSQQKEVTTAASTMLSLPVRKVDVPSSLDNETTGEILDSPTNNNDIESPMELSEQVGGKIGDSSTPEPLESKLSLDTSEQAAEMSDSNSMSELLGGKLTGVSATTEVPEHTKSAVLEETTMPERGVTEKMDGETMLGVQKEKTLVVTGVKDTSACESRSDVPTDEVLTGSTTGITEYEPRLGALEMEVVGSRGATDVPKDVSRSYVPESETTADSITDVSKDMSRTLSQDTEVLADRSATEGESKSNLHEEKVAGDVGTTVISGEPASVPLVDKMVSDREATKTLEGEWRPQLQGGMDTCTTKIREVGPGSTGSDRGQNTLIILNSDKKKESDASEDTHPEEQLSAANINVHPDEMCTSSLTSINANTIQSSQPAKETDGSADPREQLVLSKNNDQNILKDVVGEKDASDTVSKAKTPGVEKADESGGFKVPLDSSFGESQSEDEPPPLLDRFDEDHPRQDYRSGSSDESMPVIISIESVSPDQGKSTIFETSKDHENLSEDKTGPSTDLPAVNESPDLVRRSEETIAIRELPTLPVVWPSGESCSTSLMLPEAENNQDREGLPAGPSRTIESEPIDTESPIIPPVQNVSESSRDSLPRDVAQLENNKDVDMIDGFSFVSFSTKEELLAFANGNRKNKSKKKGTSVLGISWATSRKKKPVKKSPPKLQPFSIFPALKEHSQKLIEKYEQMFREDLKTRKRNEVLHPALLRRGVSIKRSLDFGIPLLIDLELLDIDLDSDVYHQKKKSKHSKDKHHKKGRKSKRSTDYQAKLLCKYWEEQDELSAAKTTDVNMDLNNTQPEKLVQSRDVDSTVSLKHLSSTPKSDTQRSNDNLIRKEPDGFGMLQENTTQMPPETAEEVSKNTSVKEGEQDLQEILAKDNAIFKPFEKPVLSQTSAFLSSELETYLHKEVSARQAPLPVNVKAKSKRSGASRHMEKLNSAIQEISFSSLLKPKTTASSTSSAHVESGSRAEKSAGPLVKASWTTSVPTYDTANKGKTIVKKSMSGSAPFYPRDIPTGPTSEDLIQPSTGRKPTAAKQSPSKSSQFLDRLVHNVRKVTNLESKLKKGSANYGVKTFESSESAKSQDDYTSLQIIQNKIVHSGEKAKMRVSSAGFLPVRDPTSPSFKPQLTKKNEVASNSRMTRKRVKQLIDKRMYPPEYPMPRDYSDLPGSPALCGNDFCRLGCVCESLDKALDESQSSYHCRKVECMFECSCGRFPSLRILRARKRPAIFREGGMVFYDGSGLLSDRDGGKKRKLNPPETSEPTNSKSPTKDSSEPPVETLGQKQVVEAVTGSAKEIVKSLPKPIKEDLGFARGRLYIAKHVRYANKMEKLRKTGTKRDADEIESDGSGGIPPLKVVRTSDGYALHPSSKPKDSDDSRDDMGLKLLKKVDKMLVQSHRYRQKKAKESEKRSEVVASPKDLNSERCESDAAADSSQTSSRNSLTTASPVMTAAAPAIVSDSPPNQKKTGENNRDTTRAEVVPRSLVICGPVKDPSTHLQNQVDLAEKTTEPPCEEVVPMSIIGPVKSTLLGQGNQPEKPGMIALNKAVPKSITGPEKTSIVGRPLSFVSSSSLQRPLGSHANRLLQAHFANSPVSSAQSSIPNPSVGIGEAAGGLASRLTTQVVSNAGHQVLSTLENNPKSAFPPSQSLIATPLSSLTTTTNRQGSVIVVKQNKPATKKANVLSGRLQQSGAVSQVPLLFLTESQQKTLLGRTLPQAPVTLAQSNPLSSAVTTSGAKPVIIQAPQQPLGGTASQQRPFSLVQNIPTPQVAPKQNVTKIFPTNTPGPSVGQPAGPSQGRNIHAYWFKDKDGRPLLLVPISSIKTDQKTDQDQPQPPALPLKKPAPLTVAGQLKRKTGSNVVLNKPPPPPPAKPKFVPRLCHIAGDAAAHYHQLKQPYPNHRKVSVFVPNYHPANPNKSFHLLIDMIILKEIDWGHARKRLIQTIYNMASSIRPQEIHKSHGYVVQRLHFRKHTQMAKCINVSSSVARNCTKKLRIIGLFESTFLVVKRLATSETELIDMPASSTISFMLEQSIGKATSGQTTHRKHIPAFIDLTDQERSSPVIDLTNEGGTTGEVASKNGSGVTMERGAVAIPAKSLQKTNTNTESQINMPTSKNTSEGFKIPSTISVPRAKVIEAGKTADRSGKANVSSKQIVGMSEALTSKDSAVDKLSGDSSAQVSEIDDKSSGTEKPIDNKVKFHQPFLVTGSALGGNKYSVAPPLRNLGQTLRKVAASDLVGERMIEDEKAETNAEPEIDSDPELVIDETSYENDSTPVESSIQNKDLLESSKHSSEATSCVMGKVDTASKIMEKATASDTVTGSTLETADKNATQAHGGPEMNASLTTDNMEDESVSRCAAREHCTPGCNEEKINSKSVGPQAGCSDDILTKIEDPKGSGGENFLYSMKNGAVARGLPLMQSEKSDKSTIIDGGKEGDPPPKEKRAGEREHDLVQCNQNDDERAIIGSSGKNEQERVEEGQELPQSAKDEGRTILGSGEENVVHPKEESGEESGLTQFRKDGEEKSIISSGVENVLHSKEKESVGEDHEWPQSDKEALISLMDTDEISEEVMALMPDTLCPGRVEEKYPTEDANTSAAEESGHQKEHEILDNAIGAPVGTFSKFEEVDTPDMESSCSGNEVLTLEVENKTSAGAEGSMDMCDSPILYVERVSALVEVENSCLKVETSEANNKRVMGETAQLSVTGAGKPDAREMEYQENEALDAVEMDVDREEKTSSKSLAEGASEMQTFEEMETGEQEKESGETADIREYQENETLDAEEMDADGEEKTALKSLAEGASEIQSFEEMKTGEQEKESGETPADMREYQENKTLDAEEMDVDGEENTASKSLAEGASEIQSFEEMKTGEQEKETGEPSADCTLYVGNTAKIVDENEEDKFESASCLKEDNDKDIKTHPFPESRSDGNGEDGAGSQSNLLNENTVRPGYENTIGVASSLALCLKTQETEASSLGKMDSSEKESSLEKTTKEKITQKGTVLDIPPDPMKAELKDEVKTKSVKELASRLLERAVIGDKSTPGKDVTLKSIGEDPYKTGNEEAFEEADKDVPTHHEPHLKSEQEAKDESGAAPEEEASLDDIIRKEASVDGKNGCQKDSSCDQTDTARASPEETDIPEQKPEILEEETTNAEETTTVKESNLDEIVGKKMSNDRNGGCGQDVSLDQNDREMVSPEETDVPEQQPKPREGESINKGNIAPEKEASLEETAQKEQSTHGNEGSRQDSSHNLKKIVSSLSNRVSEVNEDNPETVLDKGGSDDAQKERSTHGNEGSRQDSSHNLEKIVSSLSNRVSEVNEDNPEAVLDKGGSDDAQKERSTHGNEGSRQDSSHNLEKIVSSLSNRVSEVNEDNPEAVLDKGGSDDDVCDDNEVSSMEESSNSKIESEEEEEVEEIIPERKPWFEGATSCSIRLSSLVETVFAAQNPFKASWPPGYLDQTGWAEGTPKFKVFKSSFLSGSVVGRGLSWPLKAKKKDIKFMSPTSITSLLQRREQQWQEEKVKAKKLAAAAKPTLKDLPPSQRLLKRDKVRSLEYCVHEKEQGEEQVSEEEDIDILGYEEEDVEDESSDEGTIYTTSSYEDEQYTKNENLFKLAEMPSFTTSVDKGSENMSTNNSDQTRKKKALSREEVDEKCLKYVSEVRNQFFLKDTDFRGSDSDSDASVDVEKSSDSDLGRSNSPVLSKKDVLTAMNRDSYGVSPECASGSSSLTSSPTGSRKRKGDVLTVRRGADLEEEQFTSLLVQHRPDKLRIHILKERNRRATQRKQFTRLAKKVFPSQSHENRSKISILHEAMVVIVALRAESRKLTEEWATQKYLNYTRRTKVKEILRQHPHLSSLLQQPVGGPPAEHPRVPPQKHNSTDKGLSPSPARGSLQGTTELNAGVRHLIPQVTHPPLEDISQTAQVIHTALRAFMTRFGSDKCHICNWTLEGLMCSTVDMLPDYLRNKPHLNRPVMRLKKDPLQPHQRVQLEKAERWRKRKNAFRNQPLPEEGDDLSRDSGDENSQGNTDVVSERDQQDGVQKPISAGPASPTDSSDSSLSQENRASPAEEWLRNRPIQKAVWGTPSKKQRLLKMTIDAIPSDSSEDVPLIDLVPFLGKSKIEHVSSDSSADSGLLVTHPGGEKKMIFPKLIKKKKKKSKKSKLKKKKKKASKASEEPLVKSQSKEITVVGLPEEQQPLEELAPMDSDSEGEGWIDDEWEEERKTKRKESKKGNPGGTALGAVGTSLRATGPSLGAIGSTLEAGETSLGASGTANEATGNSLGETGSGPSGTSHETTGSSLGAMGISLGVTGSSLGAMGSSMGETGTSRDAIGSLEEATGPSMEFTETQGGSGKETVGENKDQAKVTEKGELTEDINVDIKKIIPCLQVEEKDDGTLDVVLQGEYSDERLDELFALPGVMEYLKKAAASKKSAKLPPGTPR